MIQALTSPWKDDDLKEAARRAVDLADAPKDVIVESVEQDDDIGERARYMIKSVASTLPTPPSECVGLDPETLSVYEAAYDAYVVDKAALTQLVIDSISTTRETIKCRERCQEIVNMTQHMRNERALLETRRRVHFAQVFCTVVEMQKCEACCKSIIEENTITWFEMSRRLMCFCVIVVMVARAVDTLVQ